MNYNPKICLNGYFREVAEGDIIAILPAIKRKSQRYRFKQSGVTEINQFLKEMLNIDTVITFTSDDEFEIQSKDIKKLSNYIDEVSPELREEDGEFMGDSNWEGMPNLSDHQDIDRLLTQFEILCKILPPVY